jgi:hypothetical protein
MARYSRPLNRSLHLDPLTCGAFPPHAVKTAERSKPKYKLMNKYEVLLKVTYYESVQVKASSEEEAQFHAMRTRRKPDIADSVDVIAVRRA